MRFAGLGPIGRIAARLAAAFAPPYMARFYLARLTDSPFVDPRAEICHDGLTLDPHAFLADRVIVYKAREGGPVVIGESSHVLRDSVLETGQGGSITIGTDTFLHPRCQVMAYKGNISIGDHTAIAPSCAFYAYNHGMRPDELIKRQPLESRGDIIVGNGVWLGFGVIVLDGVTIGDGAVVGAGAVVTADIPENAIAVGSPARVVGVRGDEIEKGVKNFGSR
jgi:acetyltransferase-like isoleucine patch superfamily enzyme